MGPAAEGEHCEQSVTVSFQPLANLGERADKVVEQVSHLQLMIPEVARSLQCACKSDDVEPTRASRMNVGTEAVSVVTIIGGFGAGFDHALRGVPVRAHRGV